MKTQQRFTLERSYGTNRGGWYRDNDDGTRKYIKMYPNPDQSRVEVLANSIYGHLEIPAAKSSLHTVDGHIAVVSDEIVGRGDIDGETLASRPEIMGGFVTDALLADYDVFGLWGDNVIQTPDGVVHRIDNGGSLHFRARGKIKTYPSDDVPELHSMHDPNVIPMSDPSIAQSTAGRVYRAVTEHEMARQAAGLYTNLSAHDIRDLVGSVEFPKNTRLVAQEALLGRRAFLRSRFNI